MQAHSKYFFQLAELNAFLEFLDIVQWLDWKLIGDTTLELAWLVDHYLHTMNAVNALPLSHII